MSNRHAELIDRRESSVQDEHPRNTTARYGERITKRWRPRGGERGRQQHGLVVGRLVRHLSGEHHLAGPRRRDAERATCHPLRADDDEIQVGVEVLLTQLRDEFAHGIQGPTFLRVASDLGRLLDPDRYDAGNLAFAGPDQTSLLAVEATDDRRELLPVLRSQRDIDDHGVRPSQDDIAVGISADRDVSVAEDLGEVLTERYRLVRHVRHGTMGFLLRDCHCPIVATSVRTSRRIRS